MLNLNELLGYIVLVSFCAIASIYLYEALLLKAAKKCWYLGNKDKAREYCEYIDEYMQAIDEIDNRTQ